MRSRNGNGIVVGLLGVGVIGSGVMRVFAEKADVIAERVGCPVRLKRALVRDPSRLRNVQVPDGFLTTDPADILDDPEIDIVIEVMGGENPARDYIQRAVTNGKPIVTANKEVIAKHGIELLQLAREHHTDICFEAAVGGGIPLIRPFRQDLAANDIISVKAIINGTTNYILTHMSQDGSEFESALREAQELGYAEPDPTNDVEGFDATYKLAILASLAFRVQVRPSDIHCEGITRLHPRDFQYAKDLGYAIKLLAIAKRIKGDADGTANALGGTANPLDGLEARVHPALVPNDFLLAQVSDVFNAVHVEGDLVGKVLFYGRGAGPEPTASAIVADVIYLARDLLKGGVAPPSEARLESNSRASLRLLPMAEVSTRYYFRLQVTDRPGVLAHIARIFGDNDISIASVIQKEVSEVAQAAEIVIMTHLAREKHVRKALDEMADSPVVKQIGNFIRVEGND